MELRKRPRRRKIYVILGAVILLLALAYALINAQLQPALARLAQMRVQSAASDAMYAAVLECLEADETSTEFVDILQTQDQVYYIELNNRALNLFALRCAQVAQARVTAIGKQGIDIPMGTATGIPLLSGTGPMLHMSFSPESNVRTAFSSEFRTAGINQTLHRVVLRLEVQFAVVLPGSANIVTSQVDVPVAEHIIVGKIPQAFTDVNNEEDMLYFVPNSPDSW